MPTTTQFLQQLSDTGIKLILVQPNTGKPPPVKLHRSIGFVFAYQLYKALVQWRPNTPSKLILGWGSYLQLLHGKANAAGNTLLRIGERTIEVKE
jgi:hypothetical protein